MNNFQDISIDLMVLAMTAGVHELRMLRQDLQIMDCASQEEKQALRRKFEEQEKKKAKSTCILIGVAAVVTIACSIIKRSR
jgi:hypothetical protein